MLSLATNLIALRRNRDWTQKDLAAYARVPRSTITYLESGNANPSLRVLISVADALGVGVDELLSTPRATTRLYRPDELEVQRRSAGKVTIEKLLPDRVQGMEMDRMTVPRGVVMGGHPHLRGTKEYLFVLSGEITVSVAGQSFAVPRRHLLAFEGDQPHSYRSTGSRDAEALSVVIPISRFTVQHTR